MKDKTTLTVKFWGTRGSYPAPGAETVRFGGNTPCVEIQAGCQTIILDAGTGIIPLGRELVRRSLQSGQPVHLTLLFSHMHHDHTQGFPFFVPAFILSTRLHIFGPPTFERDLEQILAHNMIPPFFPVTLQEMGASKDIRGLSENQMLVLSQAGEEIQVLPANSPVTWGDDSVIVKVLRSYAHPGSVYVYRFEWRNRAVVYATDTEGYTNTDRRLAAFARNADLLIHDAQYSEEHYLGLAPGARATQGWGHSTASMACDVAQAAGVRQLALFHHDPGYSDEVVARLEAEARRQFAGVFAARDGQEMTLGSPDLYRLRPDARQYALAQAAIPA